MTSNLLLVDDSRFVRVAAKRALADAGFAVAEACDGEEALHQVHQNPPDLIILDMLLPRLGGELVLRALRQDPATAKIPVLVLSSLPQTNAQKLKDEGATAYLEKSKLDLNKSGEPLLRVVNAILREVYHPAFGVRSHEHSLPIDSRKEQTPLG
jgi:CheY-like chemotaxis protein